MVVIVVSTVAIFVMPPLVAAVLILASPSVQKPKTLVAFDLPILAVGVTGLLVAVTGIITAQEERNKNKIQASTSRHVADGLEIVFILIWFGLQLLIFKVYSLQIKFDK